MFYKLRTKSDGDHDNLQGRQDILSLNANNFYWESKVKTKEGKILNSINQWKEVPWRISENKLIKIVETYVLRKDFYKDIAIESALISFIRFLIIIYLIIRIYQYPNVYKNMYTPLISTIIPSIVLLIGIVVKYKEMWLKSNGSEEKWNY